MVLFVILISTYLSNIDKELKHLQNEIAPYSVSIHAYNGNITMTGTIIKNTRIVTIGFINQGDPVQVEDRYGNIYRGKTMGRDPITGLTLISSENEFTPPSLERNPQNGQLSFVYGNSFGKMGLIGMGFVQSAEGISLNMSIPLSPGNNGAGVFDSRGNLIGIVGGRVNRPGFLDDLGIMGSSGNFAEIIKASYIINTINQIEDMGTVRRAWLGIMTRNSPGDMGVVVEDVVEDSPAYEGGIRKHDLIIALNGINISNIERFREIILSQTPGEILRISFIRGKERHDVSIKLKEREASEEWRGDISEEFKIEKITPRQFVDSSESVRDEMLRQLLRISREIELLKKKLNESR